MSGELNARIIKELGAPFFANIVASGIELSEEMLATALPMANAKMDPATVLTTLQNLFPRKHETSSGGGNVFYINSSTPTTIVLGNMTGGSIDYGTSRTSRGSNKPSKSKSSSNGDWKFEGDRVFLNQQWHKPLKDTNISIAPKEGFDIIGTNNNGTKKAVGYYSTSSVEISGFTRFHNTSDKPTLKYGKGPEGYYYIKSNLVSFFTWLKADEPIDNTVSTDNTNSNENTSINEGTKEKEIKIDFGDIKSF